MLRIVWLLLAILAGASLAWVFTRLLKNSPIARPLGIVTWLTLVAWAVVELVTTGRGSLPTIILLTMFLAGKALERSGAPPGGRAA
jgi:hypothetical protein